MAIRIGAGSAPVHLHQGGTLRTYCGTGISRVGGLVAWEDAREATCIPCLDAWLGSAPAAPLFAVVRGRW